MTTVPPEAAAALRPVLPSLAEEMIDSIQREVPEYSRAMEGLFGTMVRHGVEVALGRFVDLIEDPSRDDGRVRETYVNLGRGELHAGRSLDALLAAYRVGARVAWRRFVEVGVAAGLAPEVIYRIAEAIFEYIDELSAESAEGYSLEQLAEAGERRRRRGALIALCARDAPIADLHAAAADAGWDPPRRIAALVVAPAAAAEEAADRLAREIGLGTIAGLLDGRICALVGDPEAPGRSRQIEAAVAGAPAALGPAVPFAQVAVSLRRALATLALPGSAALRRADDHLAELLLATDPALAADLAERALAPLTALPDGTRPRFAETLAAWLDRPGQVQAVAHALEVHPQTVRYRIRRLRELFGDALDDPSARFELQLALRATAAVSVGRAGAA